MKNTWLYISITITILVFSMSFVSGTESGELSSGVTDVIYRFISSIFPNNNIDIDTLHVVIRKMAHVTEYSILAISWFFTAKSMEWSFSVYLILGLLIASTDESIQIIAVDRGPSIFDALIYDFIPFMLIGTISLLIYNKRGGQTMSTDTLLKLQNNQISPESAYRELYKTEKRVRMPFFKRAHFVKLRIRVPGEKGVNTFLGILFFFPIPILFLRILMGFIKSERFEDTDMPLSKREIIRMVSYKGVTLNVKTHSGENILIKTI